jgi:uncharacterized caspase-like protein
MRIHLRLFTILGLVSAALGLVAVPAHAVTKVAFVVGNSDYRAVGRLANPANDAALVAQTLQQLGFTLVGGKAQINIDKAHFDKLAQTFGKDAHGADVAVFYYAGHGLQVDGTNYLVPVDAAPESEADVSFQLINATSILREMESSQARLKMMILDACRNNPFAGRGLRAIGGGLAQMQAPEGTLIAFSTQPGHKALDGKDGHSPYTSALARVMQKPGLDVFRTFNEVGLSVASVTHGRQRPWVSSSPIKGDFYFVPDVAKAAPVNTGPTQEESLRFYSAERIGTEEAFNDFLKSFPKGYYASLARDELKRIKSKASQEQARRSADEARAKALAEDQKRLAAEIKAARDAIAQATREAAAAKAAREAAEAAAKDAAERGAAAAKAANEAVARAKRENEAAKASQKAAEQKAQHVIAHQQALAASLNDHPAGNLRMDQSEPKNASSRGGSQVASLGTPNKETIGTTTSILGQSDIAQLLRFHLREVGCDPGDSASWDAKAKHALQDFNQYAGTHLDIETPTLATLQAVQSARGRVCPLACGRGTRREGNECVAIRCKAGSSLEENGKCRPTAKPTTAHGLVMGGAEHMRLRSECRGGSISACRTLCSNGGFRACRRADRLAGGGR